MPYHSLRRVSYEGRNTAKRMGLRNKHATGHVTCQSSDSLIFISHLRFTRETPLIELEVFRNDDGVLNGYRVTETTKRIRFTQGLTGLGM